jgi:hypothetical protein
LKLRLPWKLDELRQKLVLTPEEKRVIAFVIAAFVLGLGTKCYRDKHPQPLPYIDPKHPWRKDAMPPPSSTPKGKRSRKPRAKNPTPPPAATSGDRMSILEPSTPREKRSVEPNLEKAP